MTGEQTISINGTDFKINLGKNLFDKDNASIISGYVNQSGIIVSSPGVRILYIQCKPNTTYTVQKTNSGTNQRFCVFDSVLEPDVNVSILHSVGTRAGLDTNESYTITTEPTARYLGVFFRVAATTPSETDILDTIQIEEGNTKTDYVSYITPVELCKTGLIYTYPDTIAKDNDGDWSIIREVGIINAKNASYTKVGNCFQSTSKFPTDRVADSATKMTNFTFNSATTNISTLLANGEFGFNTSGRLTLRIDSVQTAGDFATWLNSNDSVIYYHMSNPIETKITDATLISQLNAIQAALQEGQNTVAVTANGSNLPAKTITLNGIAGREKPVLAQTNVRIGLSDGGVLNACECRQNVTLSMRETA